MKIVIMYNTIATYSVIQAWLWSKLYNIFIPIDAPVIYLSGSPRNRCVEQFFIRPQL